ncbi:hypothetical protein POUND7_002068 [Theobroma cacao]
MQQCLVHGLCGRNGMCIYAPEPKCSCPPGYEMDDPSNWNKGCKPRFTRSCSHSQQVRFVKIQHADFYGFDSSSLTNISLESCQTKCLEDCRCQAFGYKLSGDAKCYIKIELFNGHQSASFPSDIYLKLPLSIETSEPIVLNDTNRICNSSESTITIGASSSMYGTGGIRLSNWVEEDGEGQETELTRFVRVIKGKGQSEETAWIEDAVDTRLNGQFSRIQAAKMIEIGISCVEEDRNKRPTMDSIVQALMECEDVSRI